MRALLTAAALGVAAAAPAGAQGLALAPGETLLEVEAQGEVVTRPDAALVSAGVVTNGQTAAEATAANARTMTAVVAAVRGAGVAERFIRTQQISVQPQFAPRPNGGYGEDQLRILGYVARNSVAITVAKVADAARVIDTAFGAGANSVQGPNLALLDDKAAVAAARADALAQAQAEARSYAEGLGLRVARVLRVSERGRSSEPEVYAARAVQPRVSAPPAYRADATPIEAGEMRQRVTVWIDYALAPR